MFLALLASAAADPVEGADPATCEPAAEEPGESAVEAPVEAVGPAAETASGRFGASGDLGDLEEGEVAIEGRLDRDEVLAAVRRSRSQLRYCYQRARVHEPTLEGRILVRVTVRGDGTPGEVSLLQDTLLRPVVTDCVLGRFEHMRFPAGSEPAAFALPIRFVPKR